MKPLLIATTNPGKMSEVETIYASSGIELKNLKEFSDVAAPEETGATFEENAVLKAKYYFDKTGVPTLADDGGIEVDALGGLPGVKSNRWLGKHATDSELAEALIQKLDGKPRQERTARLGGVMAFWDGKNLLKAENFVSGRIAEKMPEYVQPGFPYRSVFEIPQFHKLYKDLTHDEHEQINHRRRNLEELKPKILELLEKE